MYSFVYCINRIALYGQESRLNYIIEKNGIQISEKIVKWVDDKAQDKKTSLNHYKNKQ